MVACTSYVHVARSAPFSNDDRCMVEGGRRLARAAFHLGSVLSCESLQVTVLCGGISLACRSDANPRNRNRVRVSEDARQTGQPRPVSGRPRVACNTARRIVQGAACPYTTQAKTSADIVNYIERIHNPRKHRRLAIRRRKDLLLTQPPAASGLNPNLGDRHMEVTTPFQWTRETRLHQSCRA